MHIFLDVLAALRRVLVSRALPANRADYAALACTLAVSSFT